MKRHLLLLITLFLNTADIANQTKIIFMAKILNAQEIRNHYPYLDIYTLHDNSRVLPMKLENGSRVKISATQDEFNDLSAHKWISHTSQQKTQRKKMRNI